MANISARNATPATVYIAASGAGTDVDPHIPYHQGQGAAGASTVGNPLRVGGRAKTAQPTAVTDGQAAEVLLNTIGAQVVLNGQVPELCWSYAVSAAITNTADNAVTAAGGAGIRSYCTGVQVFSGSATATQVVLKDGSTVIWRGYLPASATAAPVQCVFNPPIRTTANTALNFACITTGTSTIVSAQGYYAP